MTVKQMAKRFIQTLHDVAGDTIAVDLPFVSTWGPEGELTAASEVRVSPRGDDQVNLPALHLSLIVVPPEQRRHGYATQLLEILTRVADANGWAMTGLLRPWAGYDELQRPMTERQLKAWYRKMGFEIDKFGGMIRLPQGVD